MDDPVAAEDHDVGAAQPDQVYRAVPAVVRGLLVFYLFDVSSIKLIIVLFKVLLLK